MNPNVRPRHHSLTCCRYSQIASFQDQLASSFSTALTPAQQREMETLGEQRTELGRIMKALQLALSDSQREKSQLEERLHNTERDLEKLQVGYIHMYVHVCVYLYAGI
jgi:hypothetical protein